jgi:hypothetical protein
MACEQFLINFRSIKTPGHVRHRNTKTLSRINRFAASSSWSVLGDALVGLLTKTPRHLDATAAMHEQWPQQRLQSLDSLTLSPFDNRFISSETGAVLTVTDGVAGGFGDLP